MMLRNIMCQDKHVYIIIHPIITHTNNTPPGVKHDDYIKDLAVSSKVERVVNAEPL